MFLGYLMPYSTSTDMPKRKPTKQMRKWDDGNPNAGDMAELNYSVDTGENAAPSAVSPEFLKNLVDEHSKGTRTQDGMYEIKDLDFNIGGKGEDSADAAINRALSRAGVGKAGEDAQASSSSFGGIGGLFSRLTGSKVLTHQDLAPVISAMKDHLMKKNVAKEIAEKVCEGVEDNLKGKKIGGFNSERPESSLTSKATDKVS